MANYQKVICPKCNPAAQHSRRAGTYLVLVTPNFFILRCQKCLNELYLRRRYKNGNKEEGEVKEKPNWYWQTGNKHKPKKKEVLNE